MPQMPIKTERTYICTGASASSCAERGASNGFSIVVMVAIKRKGFVLDTCKSLLHKS